MSGYNDQPPNTETATQNPNSWRVTKPYTNHIDIRSAIVNDPHPIHFRPADCDVRGNSGGEP